MGYISPIASLNEMGRNICYQSEGLYQGIKQGSEILCKDSCDERQMSAFDPLKQHELDASVLVELKYFRDNYLSVQVSEL